jgi:hypothetical protein
MGAWLVVVAPSPLIAFWAKHSKYSLDSRFRGKDGARGVVQAFAHCFSLLFKGRVGVPLRLAALFENLRSSLYTTCHKIVPTWMAPSDQADFSLSPQFLIYMDSVSCDFAQNDSSA